MCTVIEITTTFMRNKNISSSQIFSSRESGDCGVMEHDTGPESSWHHLLFQQSELSSNSWNSLFSISKLTGEFHDTFIHRPHKHDSLTGFYQAILDHDQQTPTFALKSFLLHSTSWNLDMSMHFGSLKQMKCQMQNGIER